MEPRREMDELFDGFVRYMRSLGHAFDKKEVGSYKRLAIFLKENCIEGEAIVTQEKAFDWIANGGSDHPITRNRRASQIRVFAKYLVRAGNADCFMLPKELMPGERSDFIPYIFTHAEIEALTAKCDSIKPIGQSRFRHAIYPAMFRTIYACGLRSGEARNLLVDDVDFGNEVLFIRKTKNEDSRYVPMSPSLADFLRSFYSQAVGLSDRSGSMPFFLSPRGGCYGEKIVLNVFQDICRDAGISNQKGNPPRVHDLRHTFAVHSLQATVENGASAEVFLPVLSAYMGHKDIKSTEYYLHLTQEGQNAAIAKMMSAYCGLYKEGAIDGFK